MAANSRFSGETRVLIACSAGLAVVVAWSYLFRAFYGGAGVLRLGLLAVLAALVLALRRIDWPPRPLRGRAWVLAAAGLAIAVLGLFEAREILWAVHASNVTHRQRLDEGRTTWRAVQLLERGENPYAVGALTDDTAFIERLGLRRRAGIGPLVPEAGLEAAIARYNETFDPALRDVLLPPLAADAGPLARREAAVLGYKYGPVPLLISAGLAPLAGPGVVPLTNGIAALMLIAVLGAVVWQAGGGLAAAGLAMVAMLADPLFHLYFIFWTATDVWPLLFGFAGLWLGLHRRETGFGIAIALAVASKIMPGAIFLLLLPAARSWRAAAACAAALAVLFLPWLWLDARGFVSNFVLWGAMMAPVWNSWVYFAPPWLVWAGRALLCLPLAWLAWRILRGREARLATAFALVNMLVIAGGSAMHNNYMAWFDCWLVLAVAETFCMPVPLAPRLRGASGG